MRIAVEEKIVEIIKKKFQIEEKIPFNESFIESGLLTSMQMVDLLFELEDERNDKIKKKTERRLYYG